ncbi:MAG: DUF72 domain-containing protein [Alphaproteobacteria bacterium]|jgi:uncharacterized protein YecE (DUF72 family)|nr:DUF72 domain-containing protein [Alphaproteobacteria bacterium]
MSVHIGTSGWHYDHWVGPVYPEGSKAEDHLPLYAERFDAVEVNNTFYQLPAGRTVAAWRETAPEGFVFACKGSRYLTHLKKLKDPDPGLEKFFAALQPLGDALSAVLFQLPPRWRCNPERLEAFLQALPGGLHYAFEFRDESWFDERVYDTLAKHDAAFCLYDLDGRQSPERITAGHVYVRLHGPDGAYQGSYDDTALRGWADRIARWRDDGRTVYCFFDNDQAGYAALNAGRLKQLVGATGS